MCIVNYQFSYGTNNNLFLSSFCAMPVIMSHFGNRFAGRRHLLAKTFADSRFAHSSIPVASPRDAGTRVHTIPTYLTIIEGGVFQEANHEGGR